MDTATRKAGGLSPGMRAALSEVMAMRRDGAPREIGLARLHAAGFNEALAEMIMDHCDASARHAAARAAQGGQPASNESVFESRRQRSRSRR